MNDDPGAQNAHNPHNPHNPQHERNPAEHLSGHRWKKGQSGNPGGRPKGRSVTAALRELAKASHNGKRISVLLAERLMREALGGKYPFAREVLERLEGKAGAPPHEEGEPGGFTLIVRRREPRVYGCPPPRVLGEADGDGRQNARVVPP